MHAGGQLEGHVASPASPHAAPLRCSGEAAQTGTKPSLIGDTPCRASLAGQPLQDPRIVQTWGSPLWLQAGSPKSLACPAPFTHSVSPDAGPALPQASCPPPRP